MSARYLVIVMAACLMAGPAGAGDIVLESARLRAVLGDDGQWRSLVDKVTGVDYAPPGWRQPFASALLGEAAAAHHPGTDFNVIDQQKMIAAGAAATKRVRACRAALVGDRLTIGLEGGQCELAYRVRSEPEWIALTLSEVAGNRPTELVVVEAATTLVAHVGPRLAAGWDDNFAIGLASLNLQAHATAAKKGDRAILSATTQDGPGPRLEGAAVALVGAPPAQYRAILQRLAIAYDLPRNDDGTRPSKELPVARGSYWFLSFGEAEVDKVIECCRQTGFRQVMLASGAWCRDVGHYTFQTARYPDGLESLRRTVARLHAAGILVGMHGYASKVSKTDAYVTPVPDRRFWIDRRATLAADVSASDATIRTTADLSQWPGSPLASQKLWEGGVAKHQEVVIDDEIIRYRSIGPEGRWNTFMECERGAWGTRASAHSAGAKCRHYAVDGCINGYIIDQETTLLDEVTTRLAEVFNACDFDMVYFDGGEDVDRRRFVHYVSKFQAAAMRKFRKRPIVHMGTIVTHNLWHSFTRSGTVDTYPNTIGGHIATGGAFDALPSVRQHIDTSVKYMLSIRDDMMPGELGWFGIWPRGRFTDGLQLDEMEYLMVRSLAYDAPISLQTSFSQMDRHPLTPGLLEIVRAYEALRASGPPPESLAARMREPARDFILVQEGGRPHFVKTKPLVRTVAPPDVRVVTGERPGGAVAAMWHWLGKEGRIRIVIDPARVRAANLAGEPIPVTRQDRAAVVPFGPRRTTVFFDGLGVQAANEALLKADVLVP